MLSAFTEPGEWLKGNLHTHTTNSDGRLTPEQRLAAYEARGYDFLAWRLTRPAATISSPSPTTGSLLRAPAAT